MWQIERGTKETEKGEANISLSESQDSNDNTRVYMRYQRLLAVLRGFNCGSRDDERLDRSTSKLQRRVNYLF